MNQPTIFDLKSDAHGLIDELVMMGVHRNVVYRELRARLGVTNGWEHLGKMATVSQVERAISVLRNMKSVRGKYLKQRRQQSNKVAVKPKTANPAVLPLKDQKIAYEALRQQNTKPQSLLSRVLLAFTR